MKETKDKDDGIPTALSFFSLNSADKTNICCGKETNE